MNILFFGTESTFSRVAFQHLSQSGHTIVGLVLPQTKPPQLPLKFNPLPVINPPRPSSLLLMAQQQSVPVLGWGALLPAADVLLVACFPKRLLPTMIAHPRLAALNLHPSLLPEFRGPAPVFWQLQAGLPQLGVSVHHLDATFDTGPLLAQQIVTLPHGATGPEIDQKLVSVGLQLMLDALDQPSLPKTPQPLGGSYQSWPQMRDWAVPTDWSALHAYNFVRGTAEWGFPYFIHTGQRTLQVRNALALRLDSNATPGQTEADESQLWVGFRGGWLRLALR